MRKGVDNMIKISEKEYYDKVYACWMGKNIGGTLGTPLERMYGEDKMFDIWWYPELKEGGIPNDDLELQLIWLKALEDKGFEITSRDLVEYWLDHIQYNFDEYGLNKTNLKLGLIPPISGYYNNWFKDCMGSPIRSEIWACIAPGVPSIAANYAYEDAIVDHAGGESVYGEMFNAAVEASAFVVNDKEKLLEIGLSYIPKDCKTAMAIKDALEAYKKGMDWKEARDYVLKRTYSKIAQYSPVDLGFQTIGLLYGDDLPDALCKAVNCGYDTDCTGATLGSILGIMHGTKAIPQKWSEPLSDKLATNASWGGIINVEKLPDNLEDLTTRVCMLGKKALKYFDTDVVISESTDTKKLDVKNLYATDKVKSLWSLSPTKINFDLKTLKIGIEYTTDPIIKPNIPKKISLELDNVHPMSLKSDITINLPEGWEAQPRYLENVELQRGENIINFEIIVKNVKYINQSNRGNIRVVIHERPSLVDIPLVLLGARRWIILRTEKELDPEKIFDTTKDWQIVDFEDNELKVEPYFKNSPGVLYLKHFVLSHEDKEIWAGVPSNCPFKLWLNGKLVHKVDIPRIPRPNYGGDGSSYTNITLKKGWNQFMIELTREDKPVNAYFVVSTSDIYHHGITDIIENKLPWE